MQWLARPKEREKEKKLLQRKVCNWYKQNTFIPRTPKVFSIHLVQGNCMHALQLHNITGTGLCLHGADSHLSFSHLTPREIDSVKCKCSCCFTSSIRHLWLMRPWGCWRVQSYLSRRLCVLSAIIWDLFSIFLCWCLKGQPPQPGNRCVSEPLISI